MLDAKKQAQPWSLWSVLVVVALVGSGCIVAANTGNLQSPDLMAGDDSGTADINVSRQAVVVGTAVDFRYARVVSSIEMLDREYSLEVNNADVNTPKSDTTYLERRFFRLDVPVLSLWDFEGGGLGYPGTLHHRHSIDVWGRVGVVNVRDDFEGFTGGALTYYQTDLLAVSLTVDRWNEPAEMTAVNQFGSLTRFDGSASGWVVGVEFTLAAGEYGLDFFKTLFDWDAKARETFPARRISRK